MLCDVIFKERSAAKNMLRIYTVLIFSMSNHELFE
jgi:hypothetical protein